ncbi:helix-turn-helix transcriptional regulator [Spirillospora sp. NPDC047279]|uniref:helix-turn-helix domain-containing protein n=1 Tax=Spirillospora sp. NPDC047279 TaxID=3155478 RepID=UPI0033F543CA
MARADELDPDNNPWHWLAVDLRVWRLMRNVTQVELGEMLNVSNSRVAHLESGGSKLSEAQVQKLDRAWKTHGHFSRLHRHAVAAHDPNWFAAYTKYESQATSISAYSALTFHALLQTPAYARALIEGAQMAEDVEETLELRMARQEVLSRSSPPDLGFLIKESVVTDLIGGIDVMREQLGHLLDLSQRRRLLIQVVPRSAGAHAGVDGSFTLLSLPRQDFSWSPAVGGGRLDTDPKALLNSRIRYRLIGADALSRGSTRSFIARTMEALQ